MRLPEGLMANYEKAPKKVKHNQFFCRRASRRLQTFHKKVKIKSSKSPNFQLTVT
jgi:hypothetical protein